jgi:hypothetical protein
MTNLGLGFLFISKWNMSKSKPTPLGLLQKTPSDINELMWHDLIKKRHPIEHAEHIVFPVAGSL